jgi:hypothetical protein
MEPNSRECLRRAVRRAVHQACWRRLDGDHALIHADPSAEIAAARAAHHAIDVTDEDVRIWIAEDEAEFDRAILISDLVARRVLRTAAPAGMVAPAPRVEPTPSAARDVDVRTPVRTAPSITALLDDMLAQQRVAPHAVNLPRGTPA